MTHDLSSLENALHELRPVALDDALMERLEDCAAGTWDGARPVELEIEHRMRIHVPAPLDDLMTQRLLAQTADLPFPEEPPKILPFPSAAGTEPASRQRQSGRWLTAAAAVALMGALAGWFLSDASRNGRALTAGRPAAVDSRVPSMPHGAGTRPSPLVPASLNRDLSEASDEGVVMYGNRHPHRVLRFVYRDQVTLKDAEGRTYQVEQSRVEYLIVPAKTD